MSNTPNVFQITTLAILLVLGGGCGSGDSPTPTPTIDLTPRPNLAISVLETNPVSPTTAGFDIIVKFSNIGSILSPASTLLLEQQTVGGWSVLGSQATPTLGPSAGSIITFTTVSGGVTAGSLTIRATIMPVTDETALTNNEATLTVLVAPAGGG